MQEDPVYRQNQRDSNRTWRENNPDYWKTYREKHPEKAAINRMKQQIRNQKKRKADHPVAKETLKKSVKMALVDWVDALQGQELWLVSRAAVIPPIKLSLLVHDKKNQPIVKNVMA